MVQILLFLVPLVGLLGFVMFAQAYCELAAAACRQGGPWCLLGFVPIAQWAWSKNQIGPQILGLIAMTPMAGALWFLWQIFGSGTLKIG